MAQAVIASAVRTPIGAFTGALAGVPATELGAIAAAAAVRRAGIDPERVDEVLIGNVLQAGLGQNPARQAALRGGLPESVPCTTINKVCGSGLKAVGLAAQAIAAGDARVLVAGGMENMSASPHLLSGLRTGHRMGDVPLVDSMVRDGLWCAFCDVHMGMTAENVAAEDEMTRAEQDAFALRSQRRAAAALDAGTFDDEIVGVPVPERRGEPVVVDRDEFPRPDTTAERLAALRPAFDAQGTVTAGTSSGINDGAAALVVMSAEAAREQDVIHGGAIALGHPIGASGARVLTTLLHEMARRGARLGVAALCIGGGQGIAMVIERPEGAPGG